MCKDHRVLRHDYPGQVCSIAKSLEVIGERWTLLIVRDVMNGQRRFDQLQASLGVARNVLRGPPWRDLCKRTSSNARPYQSAPPRFEYFLTEKGLDLWPALIALIGWGDRHSLGPQGPPMLIVHKECGGAGQRSRHLRKLRQGAARSGGKGPAGAGSRRRLPTPRPSER